ALVTDVDGNQYIDFAGAIGTINARTMRETITGVAKGITEDGVLLLEDHEGKVHHIHSIKFYMLGLHSYS
ncbi:hypothetical protein ACT453_28130, partial [Bacillus sp. D-CC]